MTRVGKTAISLGLLLLLPAGAPAQDSTAIEAPVARVYAAPGGVALRAYVFDAKPDTVTRPRPAILLFHGGGWSMGEAEWAFPRARHFARRGMIAVAVQYRLSDQKGVTPIEAIADARAAFRWVREHAESLGLDPKRVAGYGWSAGGHLAVCAAMFDEDAKKRDPRAAPNALVLVSPALSLATDHHVQRLLGDRAKARDISPDEHVRKGLPPTLILMGDTDTITPLRGARRFHERMRAAGNLCDLHVYEGFGHLFTPAGIPDEWPQPDSTTANDAMARADRFLQELGFMP